MFLSLHYPGVLVDATGTYDFPFYLAGICFMFCALFTSALPISKCFRRCFCLDKGKSQEDSKWSHLGLYAKIEQTKETRV